MVQSEKADKVSESFENATLENSWTGTLKYKKTETGLAILCGSITPGTTAFGTSITTLPNGYKPLETGVSIPVLRSSDNTLRVPFYIGVDGILRVRDTALPISQFVFHVVFLVV